MERKGEKERRREVVNNVERGDEEVGAVRTRILILNEVMNLRRLKMYLFYKLLYRLNNFNGYLPYLFSFLLGIFQPLEI